MSQRDDKSYRERVFDIVRAIPAGRIMTYGQIAIILGEGYTARTVGYVMSGADAEDVPWQRVINSQGKCSTARLTIPINLQQELLEAEGVSFSKTGRCDLTQYRWFPDGSDEDDDDRVELFYRPATDHV
jgi:methylated-DNA-protein-cysteine methyltransferase related protein